MAKLTKKKLTKKKTSKKSSKKKNMLECYEEAVLTCSEFMSDSLNKEESELVDDASFSNLPKKYVSISQITSYLMCPQKYKRSYIDGVRGVTNSALVEGSTHHEVLEDHNIKRILEGKGFTADEAIELFNKKWKKNSKEIEDWQGETFDSVMGRASSLMKSYMMSFDSRINPLTSEQVVCVPIGNLKVLGVLDLLGMMGSRLTVADYKVVSKKKSEAELVGSLQLSFYAYAIKTISKYSFTGGIFGGKKVKDMDVGFCSFNKKKGLVEWQSVEAADHRIEWMRRVVLSVSNAINMGIFPMTDPTNWVCSPKWCESYSNCRGSCK